MFRRLLAVPSLGVPLLLLAPAATAEDKAVQATAQNTFTPATVTINRGDSVTWTSSGGVNHTVTSSSSNWSHDASLPVPTRTTSFTFENAGTYTYYCKTHGTPSSGMRGTVVVRAPATSSPKPSPKPTTSSPTPAPTRTTASPEPTDDPDPEPSATSPAATPTTQPSATASPGATRSPGRSPSGDPEPSATPSESPPPVVIGLALPPPTGRERGLPIALALVALGGVVSAQVRALLAEPVRK